MRPSDYQLAGIFATKSCKKTHNLQIFRPFSGEHYLGAASLSLSCGPSIIRAMRFRPPPFAIMDSAGFDASSSAGLVYCGPIESGASA